MESKLCSSLSDNRTLLDLFLSFVGTNINEIFWKPVLWNEHSDSYKILDEYKRREKLKMASVALLKSVDNVNYTDDDGKTFLHHFIEILVNENTNLSTDRLAVGLLIIQSLIDQGASVDVEDNEGWSPYGILLDYRQKDILRLVLPKFNNFCICSINNCRDKQMTSSNTLYIKSVDRVIEVLEYCLENQIDFNIITNTNATPLMILCMLSFNEKFESEVVYLVDILIKGGCNVNAVDSKGYTALLYAIEMEHLDIIIKLIELGADMNQPTEYQLPPLYNSAIKSSQNSIIDYNSITFSNVSPLIFTIIHSCLNELVDYLVDNGANVNCSEGISGFKPLHLLMFNDEDHPYLLDLILEKESDINARTKCGLTAIHLAALTDKYWICKRLIERGADVNCRESSFGLTAMHLACMTVQKFYDMLKECRQGCDATTLTVRLIASFLSHYEKDIRSPNIVFLLAKNGASVNVRDTLGMTPLHYVTSHFNQLLCNDVKGLLQKLLKLGAYVNRPDNNGLTPLHNIVDQQNVSAMKYLLRFGADLNDIETKYLDMAWFKHIKSNKVYCYIVKLKVAKLICPGFPKLRGKGSNGQTFKNTHQEYSRELSKIKKYLIEDRVSLYDWLRWNYTRAQPFYLHGVPFQLKSEFPIYYEIIEARNRMVTERIPLLELAKLAWYQITKIHLPEICVERILFHLSNRYLHFLIDNNKN